MVADWRVVSVAVVSVRVCLFAVSQPAEGLVDRSAERQDYGMERRWYQNMQRGARIESLQEPRILYPAKSWAPRRRDHE